MLAIWKDKLLKIYDTISFVMNLLSFIMGIFYLGSTRSNPMWNIYGFLMLITLFSNIRLAAVEEKDKRMGCFYLALSAGWMLVVILMNTYVSISPSHQNSQSILSNALILSLFLIGGFMSFMNIIFKRKKEVSISIKGVVPDRLKSSMKNISKNVITIMLSILLFAGLFLIFILLRQRQNSYFEIFIPEYALFYGIIFLSIGVLIRKIVGIEKHFVFSSIILTVTMLIFMVCMLPFVYVPGLIRDAEKSFGSAFEYEYQLNPAFRNNHFRQVTFSIPEYFFGTRSGGYRLEEHVLFYQGTEGKDQGLELYFDVYMPNDEGNELPGGNSVLIRIHGGSWTSGDKGMFNFAQMNKYFAAQGYVVFDIQYGLHNGDNTFGILPSAKQRNGDFTIDDMVRHIGKFTTFLADQSERYRANIDSVFISGGSAGGQLALAAGLGLVSEEYSDRLDSRIKVKGFIPFYPGNGLSRYVGIDGSDEFVDPMYLVTKESPPCIIYQGSHDGIVDAAIATHFRNHYIRNGNKECAILSMPFGSHCSDLYFSGYYNQVFLYYMERFIYQYK